jgi:hypothetical protein
MKLKSFTNKEIMAMPYGTLVKIKDHYKCDSIYKKGGKLVFQTISQTDDDEKQFGIEVEFGPSYIFPAAAYQLIEKKIPLDDEEMARVVELISLQPGWIKAGKEEDARQLIQWLCEDNPSISFKQLQPFQIRVIKGDNRVDIFPQTRKFHDITHNIRGTYKDLLKFLHKQFNIVDRGI